MDWINIERIEKVDEIYNAPSSEFNLIFKHSTRCSISRMALKIFEAEYVTSNIKTYYLDLITFRTISNYIEEKFNVIHQSPQVLLIKNKEVVYHDSHHSINTETIQKIIADS